ncbi:hypothetical protein BM1_08823 [Bipolaris maydis]|nr:hypothetical protein BM1_08823 [Bipolaris maydis]
MDRADSDPIQVLQWVLGKISPGDVVSSSARESFQQFLRRGTAPQLRQLLSDIQESGLLLDIADAHEFARFASTNNIASAPADQDDGHRRKRKNQLSKSQDLVLSQGRGKITAAFELQAEILSTSVEVVKSERKAGRGYLQLLIEGGPGFILRLGCNVSTIWERKLSNTDIRLIIDFLKAKAPALHKDIISYNEAATRALLDGFIAYGWSRGEILKSHSALFSRLREFVDLEDMLQSAPRYGPPQSPGGTLSGMRTPETLDDRDFCSLTEGIYGTPHSDPSFSTLDRTLRSSSCTSGLEAINTLSQITDEELESLLCTELEYSAETYCTTGSANSSNLSMWHDMSPNVL